jgi:hypothetical protein
VLEGQQGGVLPFSCQPVGTGGPWQAQTAIAADTACGAWHLRDLHLVDRAGRRADLDGGTNPIVAALHFAVSSGRLAAQSVSVMPAAVSNQADSHVQIAIDICNGSSPVTTVTGRVDGAMSAGGPRAIIWFNAQPGMSGTWLASITVPRSSTKGTWQVGYLQVLDQARNGAFYMDPSMPPLLGATFEVQ